MIPLAVYRINLAPAATDRSQPLLTNLRLERFKNFKDAELPLGPPTLLVGTNASGKSNLRDAFRFLHGISRGYTLAEIIKRILDIPDTHRILEKQDLAQLHAYGWLEDAVSSLEGSCVQPVPRGVQISHLCWRLRVPPSLPPARVSRAAPLAADRRKYTSHGVNNTLNRRSTGHEQDFQPAMLHCPLAADDPLLSDAMNRTGTGPEQVRNRLPSRGRIT